MARRHQKRALGRRLSGHLGTRRPTSGVAGLGRALDLGEWSYEGMRWVIDYPAKTGEVQVSTSSRVVSAGAATEGHRLFFRHREAAVAEPERL